MNKYTETKTGPFEKVRFRETAITAGAAATGSYSRRPVARRYSVL